MTLNKLEELEKKAAKGPWDAEVYGDFIAESRNALPALLKIARAAKGCVEEVTPGLPMWAALVQLIEALKEFES